VGVRMRQRRRFTGVARRLRKTMTDAERTLWGHLRRKQLGTRFRRQEPIGSYVVDFVSFETKLVIELDGGQHAGQREDMTRDRWLTERGYRVLRFWDNEVLKNIEGVLEVISQAVTPSPLSPPVKGGDRRGRPPIRAAR